MPTPENWRIERLARGHDRSTFACGKEPLDTFLRWLVSRYEKRDLGRTFVLVRIGEPRVHGEGLGERLLVDALRRALSLAGELVIHAVEVDAIDAAARDFYRQYGFVPLRDRDLHLYLPIRTIARLWA